MNKGTQRKLAAIVSADVVGYSRLMGVDETGTLAAMRAHRSELWNPVIEQHGGRVVGTAGDSLLIEYASAVAAVESAITVQRGMIERNADLPEERRMLLRIGVNIGEVVIDGEDIFGDGVNVAARLQVIAESGGIAISSNIHEQVNGKLDVAFIDDGEHEVKNIDRPVHVWRWSPNTKTAADKEGAMDQSLALPDKPSIAVLPFDNMSGDPEQEYFSDGITEDIITALSKFRWFFVTARNSTFTYKGTAIDIKQVGRELGVRYVLEGSVRKAGSRIRITAQLIEAESGNHVWAERYDRKLDDIFELQDEITLTIAAAVAPELASFERERAMHKPTQNLQVWDLFHRGTAQIWHLDEQNLTKGAETMRRALTLDPQFGHAYSFLAFVDFWNVIMSRTPDREQTLQQGMAHARKALSIDPRDYFAHWPLGRLHSVNGDHQIAIRELETSVSINPNFAMGYSGLAAAHLWSGHAKEAIIHADMAIRLSPHDPYKHFIVGAKGLAYGVLGDIDKCIACFEECIQFPAAQFLPFAQLAALYAITDRPVDAAAMLDRARSKNPGLSLQHMKNWLGNADEKSFRFMFEGFRKVGLT